MPRTAKRVRESQRKLRNGTKTTPNTQHPSAWSAELHGECFCDAQRVLVDSPRLALEAHLLDGREVVAEVAVAARFPGSTEARRAASKRQDGLGESHQHFRGNFPTERLDYIMTLREDESTPGRKC